MPCIAAHLAPALVLASAAGSPLEAAAVLAASVAADGDVLAGRHRWWTHGVPAALLVLAASLLLGAPLVGAAYLIHVAVDVFVAPAPLLAPLSRREFEVDISIRVGIGEGRTAWAVSREGVAVLLGVGLALLATFFLGP